MVYVSDANDLEWLFEPGELDQEGAPQVIVAAGEGVRDAVGP